MNQAEDLLQGLIEQLESGTAISNVASDLPPQEAEVIQLIAALRQMPAPLEDEAVMAAQEAQLLTAVQNQYAPKPASAAAPPVTAVFLNRLQTWWNSLGNNRELAFGLTLLFLIIAVTWLIGGQAVDSEKIASSQFADKSLETSAEPVVVTAENGVAEPTAPPATGTTDNTVTAADETAVAAVPTNSLNTAYFPILTVSMERNAQTAVIENREGLVQIQTDGSSWQTINNDTTLLAGQRIRTGDLSQASLTFYDGSQAHLSANTELSLDQLNAQRPEAGFRTIVMTQWLGDSDHEVEHRGDGGSLYEVKTPEGSGIARGTKFHVIVTPNQLARYIVTEGKVDVTSLNQTVAVTAGQLTTLLVGSPPAAPTFSITGEGEASAIGSEWTIAGQTFATHALTLIIGNPQVGDLVYVEGHLLEDGSRVADRIILLRRAIVNHFSLTGEVSAMGPVWTVAGQAIAVTGQTVVDAEIAIGDNVRVDGIILADGILQAQAITRLDVAPGLPFQFSGVVQTMNEASWLVSGQTIALDGETAVAAGIDVGSTVAVEGWILDDNIWLATDISLLADDLPTFDFTGLINGMNPWVVAGIGFQTRDWTLITPGLAVGDEVRVQGTILSDGTWVADSITRLNETLPNTVTFIGVVTSINPWIVNGLTLVVNGNTTIIGNILPGITVVVQAQLMPNGTWTVLSIRTLYPDFGLGCLLFSSPVITTNSDIFRVKHWHLDIKKDGRFKIHGDLKVNSIIILPICTGWDGTIIIIRDIIVIYQPIVIIINNGNNIPNGCRVTSKGSIKCSNQGSKKKKS